MTLTSPDTPGAIPVTVWDLEMHVAPTLVAPASPDPALRVVPHRHPAPQVSRDFYRLVGADWYWVDRLGWSDEQWHRWVDRPEHHLRTCWWDDDPVGYYELEQQPDGVVELVYFGLLGRFQRRGIGRWLLCRAIAEAWEFPGTTRLWLHTCSVDGPTARANYEARGFAVCGQGVEHRLLS